jgi:hypothetical protein
MKIVFGSLLIVLSVAPSIRAQTESFDIATYVRPPGWSSAVSNGILVLQTRQSHLGRVEFCQIYLFPSTPSSQSPAANFQNEWNARIVQSMGLSVRPAPQTETTPDGWTVLTGFADGLTQGVPVRTMLITATGFGKSMTFLVTVSPGSYQKELNKFFQDLNLNAKSQPPPPSGNALAEAHSAIPAPPSGGLRRSRISRELHLHRPAKLEQAGHLRPDHPHLSHVQQSRNVSALHVPSAVLFPFPGRRRARSLSPVVPG